MRRFRRRQTIAASALLLCGAALTAYAFTPSASSNPSLTTSEGGITLITFLRFAGIFLLASGITALLVSSLNAARRRRVLETVQGKPEEVVWVFLEKVAIGGKNATATLALRPHFCLRDGTHAWFQTSGGTARRLFEFFQQERPDVSLGYSRELWKTFRRDPASLRADPLRCDDLKESRISYLYRGPG